MSFNATCYSVWYVADKWLSTKSYINGMYGTLDSVALVRRKCTIQHDCKIYIVASFLSWDFGGTPLVWIKTKLTALHTHTNLKKKRYLYNIGVYGAENRKSINVSTFNVANFPVLRFWGDAVWIKTKLTALHTHRKKVSVQQLPRLTFNVAFYFKAIR